MRPVLSRHPDEAGSGCSPPTPPPGGGRALIDWELYLPEGWTDDRARCRRAGIGDDVQFATKPELARLVPRRRRCHYQAMVDVTVEARNDAGNPGLVKLQDETWELNIWATAGELWKLAGIEETDWAQRRTLKVGTCAGVPVWWNELDGTVYILVGNDDEAWDMCVSIPLGTVHELLGELGERPEVTPPPFGPTLF